MDSEEYKEEKLIRSMLMMGIPMGFQNVITATGGLVVQSAANSFGVLFLAGYTAANKLYALLEIAASSYGYAISTYTAQNMGAYSESAEREARVMTGVKTALLIGVVTALLMSVIMLLFGKWILQLFLPETAAIDGIRIGYEFLCLLACFFPFLYILYIIRSCIQGMGNSFIPMLSSLMQVTMRMLCALGLVRIIGYPGLFWGEAAAWIGADIFLAVYIQRKFYSFTRLTR